MVVLLITQKLQSAVPATDQRAQTVLAGNVTARNMITIGSAVFAIRKVIVIVSIVFAGVGFVVGMIAISQSGGYLWDLPRNGIGQVAPTASSTPVPPLDKQLEEALTISGNAARDSALFIVAQDAVINMDYWTAIRAADASPSSASEAQSLSFVARCAIEDGNYDMAAEAAARIGSSAARNQMQLEVIAERKAASSAQTSYDGDRENMICFNLPSQ